MRVRVILAIGLLLAAVQFADRAEAREQLNQNDAVNVDPQKSYIFFRTRERLALQFLREVTPEEHAQWVAARAVALVAAQRRYERAAMQYRGEVEYCSDRPPPCMRLERPTPVTDENFAFTPAEADNFVAVSQGPQFTRAGEDEYTYLVAVPPGTYILYGQVVIGGNGAAGVCLCMGSVRFEARAGQIMDLGEIRYPATDIQRRRSQAVPGVRPAAVEIVPYAASMPRPERLNNRPVVPAEFRASGKMPNYFGILIDRHPAMPGVLRYQRDRVIDDRTGNDPVSLIDAAGRR